MTPRVYRPYSELPRDLKSRLAERTEAAGENMSYLFFHWVATAAALADAGFGELLPQERQARRGSLGGTSVPVRWIQSEQSYARCKASIDAAGSSVPAVLRQATQRYLAATPEAAVTSWPAKSVIRKAAA